MMNDFSYHSENTASERPLAPIGNSSVATSSSPELSGQELSLFFGNFFDQCRKITETEQLIHNAIRDNSEIKLLLSRLLDHSVDTQEDFRNAMTEIRPIIDFWRMYGVKLNSVINSEVEAQTILDAFQSYPKLKQEIGQLQNEIADKEKQIDTLQETVVKKQLDETNTLLEEERNKNFDLTAKINTLVVDFEKLKAELSISKTENQRITAEVERLKDELAQEQSSYQDEIEKVKNAYRSKSEQVEALQTEILNCKIIRGLIADAFKIDTRTETEYVQALETAKGILRACVEMGRNSSVDENIIERIEDILKDNDRVKTLEETINTYKASILKLNNEINRKDAELYDKELKLNDSNDKLSKMASDMELHQQRSTALETSNEALQDKLDDMLAELELRNKIIQCFQDISDDINAVVLSIENTDNGLEGLQTLEEILNEFKQLYSIYFDFINALLEPHGTQLSTTTEASVQKQILAAFSDEYKRVLTLCQSFEDNTHLNAGIDLERLENHQAEMNSAIDHFYQYARKSTTDPALGNGTTLFEKITLLPSVQEQLSRSIESAIFSIDYSRAKVEEYEDLHNRFNDLQLQYEKQSNVLGNMEKKIYPTFMTTQSLGRHDKLIDDIEFALANDSVEALALKSYLGLLSAVEKEDSVDISDDTVIDILQRLPVTLYNFYQNTILEGATDSCSDEAIYDIMKQLMNKINKSILKGRFFLQMPRLGSSISLDSMNPQDPTSSVVTAVISWQISDAHHKIKHKALVN